MRTDSLCRVAQVDAAHPAAAPARVRLLIPTLATAVVTLVASDVLAIVSIGSVTRDGAASLNQQAGGAGGPPIGSWNGSTTLFHPINTDCSSQWGHYSDARAYDPMQGIWPTTSMGDEAIFSGSLMAGAGQMYVYGYTPMLASGQTSYTVGFSLSTPKSYDLNLEYYSGVGFVGAGDGIFGYANARFKLRKLTGSGSLDLYNYNVAESAVSDAFYTPDDPDYPGTNNGGVSQGASGLTFNGTLSAGSYELVSSVNIDYSKPDNDQGLLMAHSSASVEFLLKLREPPSASPAYMITAVPEPASLVAIGLAGLVIRRRRA